MSSLQLVPAALDITIFKGSSFPANFVVNSVADDGTATPLDLTSYDAQLLVYGANGIATPYDTLTKDNGRLVLGGTAGSIAFNFTIEELAAYAFTRAFWALYLTDASGNTSPLLGGAFTLTTTTSAS
jgi:hypothetical protein